ncbi:MAG: hypothetical protein JSV05_09890 [Candidatus Bathyarchaeota archaeon]|nr:MAG: hypothetical protein JSV05_09890 [Candidatus Bathyarchaeota archaeon]
MKLKAELSLAYKTEKEAEAVVKSVSPDNINVPLGLKVKTARKSCDLWTLVLCEKSLETFIATLDDFLACVSIAEKAFETINSNNKGSSIK